MNISEALSYIQSVSWLGSRPGLERVTELLHRLGDPQNDLKFVHVAGTNGKGSTSAMLASVLREAGYKTGLYISPHLQKYNERFNINGGDISDDELCAVAERVKKRAGAMDDKPTEFELITAMALQYFKEKNCDIVVLEAGLGGRLDATNAIPAPEVAVITNFGLEHTEVLGNTIERIAAEKGGIIKSGCAAVCYDSAPEAVAVLRDICSEKGVPFTCVNFAQIQPVSHSLEGQRFVWKGREELAIPLLGEHQLRNAAVALEAVEALRGRGWSVPDESVRRGLARTVWPARLEILSREPLFLLDGGHNPQCVRALVNALGDYLPGKKVTFLMGVLADKDVGAMLDMVCPRARRFVCVTPSSTRAMPADVLAGLLTERGFEAAACGSVPGAIEKCLAFDDSPVVAFGSLYMAGEMRGAFGPVYRRWLRKKKIKARDALSAEERALFSKRIVQRITESAEFREAKTVLIYRAVRGEVSLGALEEAPEAAGKRLAFPLCVSGTEMTALLPKDEEAWAVGRYGILEPIIEKSEPVPPEDIDLVLCPCTVFDEDGGRLGMGAGYYDRYLEKCANARVAAVAFECQKAEHVPAQPWDRPMQLVFTERAVYRFYGGGSDLKTAK